MSANGENEKEKTILSFRMTYAGMAVTLVMLMVFGVIFFMFHKNIKKTRQTEKAPDVVLFGDSIFAYFTDENSVARKLSEKLGSDVLDLSFGGTCLSYTDRDGMLDDMSDVLSLSALLQAHAADDFRFQNDSAVTWGAPDYFAGRLEKLEKADLYTAKVIVIEHLLNDYHNAVPIEAGSDKYDEYTYEGALRSAIRTVQKQYPNAQIVVAAPPLTWYPSVTMVPDENGEMKEQRDYTNMTCATEKDFGGGTVTDYLQAQKKVAEEAGVIYIDLSESYDNTAYENIFVYSADGLHPNAYGAGFIAEYMSECLAEQISK